MRWSDRLASAYDGYADRELFAAIARNEPGAIHQYFFRFAPRLTQLARRLGVVFDDAEIVTDEVLEDCLLALLTPRRGFPHSLAHYLNAALRNRVRNDARGSSRRMSRETDEWSDPDTLSAAAAAVCSEATLRASAGPFVEDLTLPFPLQRLVSALDEGVTDEERLILTWVSNCIPHELIARWIGSGYDATGRRIRRLGKRLVEMAERYAERLSDEDWRDLEPFFRRAGEAVDSKATLLRERIEAAREQRALLRRDLS